MKIRQTVITPISHGTQRQDGRITLKPAPNSGRTMYLLTETTRDTNTTQCETTGHAEYGWNTTYFDHHFKCEAHCEDIVGNTQEFPLLQQMSSYAIICHHMSSYVITWESPVIKLFSMTKIVQLLHHLSSGCKLTNVIILSIRSV